MQDVAKRWQSRVSGRWSKGGGPVAARLWWVAFVLMLFCCLITAPLDAHRQHRKAAEFDSLSNLKQIGAGLQEYRREHELLPPLSDLVTARRALDRYLVNRHDAEGVGNLWRTPKLQTPYAVNRSLSLQPWKAFPHPEAVVAVWDTRLWWGTQRIVLFLDGHVEGVSQEHWDRLRAASGIVRDVPAPPEPRNWCDTYLPRESTENAANAVLIGAVLAAFFAGWHEAWQWARSRRLFWRGFAWWLCVRFVGYGFLVLLAAGAIGTVVGSFCFPF